MKVTKEKMAQHREKILASAAQRFRERGFDGISVSDLMKEAGLTHGGFYGHFESKEELVALASQRAMEETAARWEKVLDGAKGNPLEALATYYLSVRHRDGLGAGCLISALASETSRQPVAVRNTVTTGVLKFLDLISSVVPGRTEKARRHRAMVALSTMIGGMVLSRTVDDPALSEEILQVVAASVPAAAKEAVHP